MELVKKYIYKQVANKSLSLDQAKNFLKELALKPSLKDDIAVIGMACRLPGADNVDEYWDNLKNGICSIGEFPESRKKDVEHIWKNPGYMEFMSGSPYEGEDDPAKMFELNGYLKEWDKFDASFFGIPPREAKYMDPMQRMLLEVAWESVEDAGYGGEKIINSKTGVFVGRLAALPLYRYMTEPDPLLLTGSWEGFLASRISYLLNLRGPAMVVDTACSSALVAINLAGQSLQNNECEIAIAGGVCISYGTLKSHKGPMDMGAVESNDGKVRAFDQKATGTIWSEGFASIILKPLRKAIADRDNIHLIIKGSGVNNDGASNGISAPNAAAQEELIHKVWRDNQIDPETISYIEAHGTGTSLGDPIEIKGLTNVFRQYTEKKQFCAIGSVKTNIGHTVGTAGLAALIKVALAMKNKQIPASINFNYPNKYINFTESPVYVNDILTDWNDSGAPLRAGISAFGFSGTNSHIVVEEPRINFQSGLKPLPRPYCLTLSAKTEKSLMDLLIRYKNHLETHIDVHVNDICYTAATGRGHYAHRIAIIVNDAKELKHAVDTLHQDGFYSITLSNVYYGKHRVVSDHRNSFAEGEITQNRIQELSESVSVKLDRLKSGSDYESSELANICRLYVQGADVCWQTIYDGYDVKKISLPTYPFERVRCWADKKESKAGLATLKEISHPLLDRCVVETSEQDIFVTDLIVEQHWLLKDHRVMGNSVIPGTAYLEMAREACTKYFDGYPLEISNIIFFTPLMVMEDEKKQIQIILKKMDDAFEFSVMSRLTDSFSKYQWIKHVEGVVRKSDGSLPKPMDMNEIQNKIKTYDMYDAAPISNDFIYFGPRWHTNRKIYTNTTESLAISELSDDHLYDMDQYVLHPALLDNAVNIMGYMGKETVESKNNADYLPLSYKNFTLYGPMPAKCFSLLKTKPGQAMTSEVFTCDLVLFDEEGHVFAEVKDYAIKKVSKKDLLISKQQSIFEIQWQESKLSDDNHTDDAVSGTVLIFKDSELTANQVSRNLRLSGVSVIDVEFGDSFKQTNGRQFVVGANQNDYDILFHNLVGTPIQHIIYSAPLADDREFSTVDDLQAYQQKSIYAFFYLIKAVIKNKIRGNITITILTRSANNVTGSEQTINPHHALLQGLGKVIHAEYPHLTCQVIDVEAATPVDQIVRELSHDDSSYQVSYRDGRRYIEQFKQIKLESNDFFMFKNDGVYVITGGTGGIGLEVGKFISSQTDHVNLALVNRSKMPLADQWDTILQDNTDKQLCEKIRQIRIMENNGARVLIFNADIGDHADTKAMLDRLRSEYGTINGIIHSAGIAGSGFLTNKEEQALKTVLHPKVNGTWLLDHLTREDQLDFFIMFSSVTALIGMGGQGDYCAANCYMDAYAAYRTKVAGKTISMNWPAWSETGMAVDNQIHTEGVFKAISNLDAMNSFSRALTLPLTRVIPCELNIPVLASVINELPFTLSKQIRDGVDKQSSQAKTGSDRALVDFDVNDIAIYGKSENDYTKVERKMAIIWACVLGLKEIDIYDNYNNLGGDSLLAPQLLKIIDKEFPGMVDITDIFSYPSVIQLSEQITKKQDPSSTAQSNDEVLPVKEKIDKQKIESLLDDLEGGKSSVEDILDALS